MTKLIIRRLDRADAVVWQRLFAAVADEGLWIGAEPPVADRSGEVITKFVEWPGNAMFLAWLDDVAVGWISAEGNDGAAELGMGVLDGFRGQGIGSALMEAILGWAPTANVSRLTLRVFPHNERALGLYRKFGFVEREHAVGVWPRRNGEFWDVVFMERPVSPP